MKSRERYLLAALRSVPLLMLGAVLTVFGMLSSTFLTSQNLLNILIQSSSLTIVAVGMTFVLLTAGIDLSVGAIMFASAAVAGKMILGGLPLWLACLAVLAVGALFGLINAVIIARLHVLAFIATLATLYMGRGLSLYLTETRALNLPESLLAIGAGRFIRLPFPVWIFLLVVAAAHLILTRTPFGRQVYAVGSDIDAAGKAGIDTRFVLTWVYLLSGLCAAIGGLVAVAQLGAVSPTFGNQREFAAIAAAVLGGTSLFGGRGRVFPGTVLGAVLIQTVESGLVIVNADPYLYPMVTAAIIFAAVFLDCAQHAQVQKLRRRRIMATT